MQLPIILIGPMCSGKSTIATALAKRLSLPNYPLDYAKGYYYLKDDIDVDKLAELIETDFIAWVNYSKPYEITAVEKMVKEFTDGIIHFGAGHSHYENIEYLERARKALENISNVVLLVPSEDKEESIRILEERRIEREGKDSKVLPGMLEMNRKFVTDPSNYELAKITVYTKNKTVDHIVEEINKTLT